MQDATNRSNISLLRDDRNLAYALLRLVLGVNMLGHGLVRVLGGVGGFVDSMRGGLAKSPVPDILESAVLWAVPFVEIVIGLLVVLGLFTRVGLLAGLLLMAVLTLGSTMQSNWGAAGSQLIYAGVFSALLFLREPYNRLSIDSALLTRERG